MGWTENQGNVSMIFVIVNHYWMQFITEPTRGRNTLDLIISNNSNFIHSYDITETIMSDHKFITARAQLSKAATEKYPEKTAS